MSDPNQPPYPGSEQPPTYPPPYGQPQYPQAPYGQPQYWQAPYGYPPAYGQSPYLRPSGEYANWGLRLAAYLLDGLILIPFYIALVIGDLVGGFGGDSSPAAEAAGIAIIVAGYVGAIGFGIWNQIVRQGRTGSSLGKEWVGIALIGERTGLPIGGWSVLGRQFVHVLDALPCYLGYLWPLWDEKRQTFADKIMNTIVVRRQPAAPAYPPVSYPPGYPPAQG